MRSRYRFSPVGSPIPTNRNSINKFDFSWLFYCLRINYISRFRIFLYTEDKAFFAHCSLSESQLGVTSRLCFLICKIISYFYYLCQYMEVNIVAINKWKLKFFRDLYIIFKTFYHLYYRLQLLHYVNRKLFLTINF